MTNLQKELVTKTIPRYCKAKGITIMELAVKAGVGYADVLRRMANGDGDHLHGRLWRKVWNIINPDILDGLHQTADFRKVMELCDNARTHRRMSGLTGDTGMGKSTALKAYALRPGVWYYYIDGTVSPKAFLTELLREMGVAFEGGTHDLLNRVAEELNTQENPLLIMDECGKLTNKMILCLHSLRDKTINNCGMVLAGMPSFRNGLIRHVGKGTAGYSEFFRRINLWDELTGLTSEELHYILDTEGITDKEERREYRTCYRFGDLMNKITLHKTKTEN